MKVKSPFSPLPAAHTPRIFGIALLLLSLLTLTSCASTPSGKMNQLFKVLSSPAGDAILSSVASIGEVTEDITPENEYYIGRSVAATLTSQYPVYRDAPETTAYLNAICGAITMNSSMPFLYKNYCVAIIDTDEINAMATPGGHIFISRGLIQAVESEDALAAVIAHEIAHIQLRHSISAIKANRLTNAITQAATASALAGIVMLNDDLSRKKEVFSDEDMEKILNAVDLFSNITREMTEKLVNSGFSKSQEYEADEKALYLMADAGYDPAAMVEMLEMIPTGGDQGWDATHPKPDKRIEKVQDVLDDMQDEQELPIITQSARNARQARFEANRL